MFDYLKKLKFKENKDETVHQKQKKDKVFIVILVIFGVIVMLSFITGMHNIKSNPEVVSKIEYNFKFSLFDGIFLVSIAISYLIFYLKRRKK